MPVTAKRAGHFNGTLIGGNGRPGVFAQELSYEFTVPKGVHDLDVNVKASHDGYLMIGQLVDPNGNAVDSQIGFNKVECVRPGQHECGPARLGRPGVGDLAGERRPTASPSYLGWTCTRA